MMGTEDARKICEENYSKFDVNVTIRNLEEEAMDEDESSGVSDGTEDESQEKATMKKRRRR